ncbi:glycosyltransferase [Falsiroseomonas sp. HW251]|uniref:glycosyltransferase n=1 Tax=Falsiroseomonas sp. HW251 TaxID=3390998 RepID=UPI003D318545
MTTVNIVTSDRGWILERLAQELARNLPYVTFGDGPDPSAGIQYYMTFACRRRRLSPVEVAYFAHLEPLSEAHDRFFAVAREVEHSVCHARLYEAVLREAGVATVTTIAPGVDLETFTPRLRIGVVGRTYHTGRKGEHLVAEVMDIPEIEWRFTGEGWPGPALDLPPGAMADFYRGLDYVLVPALYEGGPMCVVEALACGTEVIAPPIGWVPEFPHVEFQAGDAADLRRVLLGLVEKKRALRASVLDRGWAGWIEGHDRLFRDLSAKAGLTLGAPAAPRRAARPRRVGLFLHGNETKSQGGPTVRVPRLARELREAGIEAELRAHPAEKGFAELDLVHAFNAWAPHTALDLLRRARRAALPTVFSPIFLDSGLRDMWEGRLVRLFAESEPGAATSAALAAFRTDLAARRADPAELGEAAPGFHAAVREMVGLADRLILLSGRERERLAAIGAPERPADIVHNPVDAAFFANADPALFRRETGLDDFVLCVARLEARKNQLMLAHALRDSGLPLVLIGHTGSEAYRAEIERHAGPGLRILDRLPPHSPLLASAYAAARVAVLPSWSEGAPLVALEAAAAGAALVLSDESGESEYFGGLARYCDPADPASIREAVLEAWETPRGADDVAAQKRLVAERFGWDRHREATEAVYAAALAAPARPAPSAAAAPVPASAPARIPVVFDVTTTAHHKGRWTGIARVEAALALALHADPRADVRFVTWNNRSRTFNQVPVEAVRAGALGSLLAMFDTNPLPMLDLPRGTAYVVGGSAWMQNSVYAESVVGFARTHGLRLTPIIHDIIPTKFPYWFHDDYAPVFEANLAMLLGNADALVAVSAATRLDIEAHARRVPDIALPDIALLREGDEIGQVARPGDAEAAAAIAERIGPRPFVLSVGAIHLRKNHRLLHDVWVKLAERMGPRCPQLILVGGVAWNGQDVARALRGDRRIAHLVTILEEVEDGALDWLYRHCLFTVYPSLYEGWGLPVAESLRYGKPCLAADTSSVPEIAPGLVELLDPLDPLSWATRIQFLAGSAAARAAVEARIAADYRPRPWSETAAELLDRIAAAPRAPRRPYVPGRVVEFSDRVAASGLRGAGWLACESWGCWSGATACELRFDLPAPPASALVLAVQARAPGLQGAVFEARVLANGEPVGRWIMRDTAVRQFHAVIPAALAARHATLTVTIENGFLSPLRQGKSDTPVTVGVGMVRAALAPLDRLRDVARFFEGAPPTPQRLELGRRRRLLADGRAQDMLAGQWVANPAWGMVSTDRRPRVEMVLQELPGRDIEIELGLRAVATAAAPLTLLVLANGTPVGSYAFADDTPSSLRFVLPAAVRSRAEPLALDLVAVEPRSPASLGLGVVEQPFGFGLLSLDAHPVGAASHTPRIVLGPGAEWRAAVAPPDLLGPDWHPPEDGGSWSFARRALLPLLLPGRAAGVTLSLAVEAFRPPPGAEAVGLEVAIGGQVLARRSLAGHEAAVIVLSVPAEACGPDGEATLEIAVDAALSPLAAGIGQDERPLGIRLVGVSRAAAASLGPDSVIGFAVPPEERALPPATAALLVGEWFPPEAGGCWSRGDKGELLVAPAAELPAGWRAFLAVRVVGAPARVDVELDGRPIDHWEFERDSFHIAEIRGLAARIAPGDSATVALRRRNAVSPRDLGRNQDQRVLGVMLLGLVAVAPEAGEPRAAALFAEAGMGRIRSLRLPDLPPPAASRPAAGPADTRPAATPLSVEGAVQATRYDFRARGAMPGLALLQWHEPEAEGRWSHGDYGEIHLTPPPERPRRLEIEIEARVVPEARSGPARAELRLEGGPAEWLDFAADAFVTARLGFDITDLEYDGPALCLWLRRTGELPTDVAGGDEDDRQLGIMVRRLDVAWR